MSTKKYVVFFAYPSGGTPWRETYDAVNDADARSQGEAYIRQTFSGQRQKPAIAAIVPAAEEEEEEGDHIGTHNYTDFGFTAGDLENQKWW